MFTRDYAKTLDHFQPVPVGLQWALFVPTDAFGFMMQKGMALEGKVVLG